MIITSKDNSKIKLASKLLKSSSFRSKEGLFVLEGLRLCMDAVLCGAEISCAFFTRAFAEKHPAEAEKIVSCADEKYEIRDDILLKLSDTCNPQGIVCLCRIPKLSVGLKSGGKYIILENVADPSNVGAISRTGEALGVDGLFVCGGCDIYNPKALRASMGALVRFPATVCDSINTLISDIKNHGIPCYASVASDSDCANFEVDYSSGAAIIIGNEAGGVLCETRSLCDRLITIPMIGRAESLNAAAAAAILIYEMTKEA